MIKLSLKIILLLTVLIIFDYGIDKRLMSGLTYFIGTESDAEVLFVGHSHTICAIDQNMIKDLIPFKTSILALHGINLEDRLALLKYYFNNAEHKPKYVVFDVDDSILSKIPESLNSHTRFYPFISDPAIERLIIDKEKNRFCVLSKKIIRTLRYNNSWVLTRALKGCLGKRDAIAQSGAADMEKVRNYELLPIEFDEESEKLFLSILEYLSSFDTKIILSYYPKIFYEDQCELNYLMVRERIENITRNFNNIKILDYNKEFGYKHHLFFDRTHLNRAGQERLTKAISQDLRMLITQTDNQKKRAVRLINSN